MSTDEWEAIPDIGDYTIKKKPKQSFAPAPDTLLSKVREWAPLLGGAPATVTTGTINVGGAAEFPPRPHAPASSALAPVKHLSCPLAVPRPILRPSDCTGSPWRIRGKGVARCGHAHNGLMSAVGRLRYCCCMLRAGAGGEADDAQRGPGPVRAHHALAHGWHALYRERPDGHWRGAWHGAGAQAGPHGGQRDGPDGGGPQGEGRVGVWRVPGVAGEARKQGQVREGWYSRGCGLPLARVDACAPATLRVCGWAGHLARPWPAATASQHMLAHPSCVAALRLA